jgi:hypothetical protein
LPRLVLRARRAFLEACAPHFDIYIHTKGVREYAENVMRVLDPMKTGLFKVTYVPVTSSNCQSFEIYPIQFLYYETWQHETTNKNSGRVSVIFDCFAKKQS